MEKAIPSAILTKGISKEGLTNLLNDIEYAVIDEGLDVITEESDKIISVIRENKPGEETEEWIKKFQDQIAVLDKVVEENIDKIEMLFERIFKDWEEYEKTNINVIDLENNEEVSDNSQEDKELDEEQQEEAQTEEVELSTNETDNSSEEVSDNPDVEDNDEVKTEGEKDE